MTAVRFVLTAVLGAVLLLAVVAAMLWAWAGPQGWPLVTWLLAVCVLIVGAGLGMSALQPEKAPVPLAEAQLEAARRLAAETLADDHLAVERYAGQAVPRHLEGDGHG